MNDKANMRSELDGNTPNREISTRPNGDQPESVMQSLVALNTWLLAFENRTDGAEQRA
jgi:hypothetical protein